MLREWEETLNNLLVFTALFSAILTAFIIDSMKYIQEDNEKMTRDILVTISRQLSNSSLPAYGSGSVEAPAWAIRANFLLFASLGFNLVAALTSVLALQWVRDYHVGLSRITMPRDKALRRHYRYQGARTWRLPEIFSILPILLHVALLLFVGGRCDWLFNINKTVATTMVITLIVSTTIYVGTQAIAAITPAALFRTPISKFAGFTWKTFWAKIKLVHVKLSDWKVFKNLHVPSLEATNEVVPTGRSARELSMISRDQKIPSSALIWLLIMSTSPINLRCQSTRYSPTLLAPSYRRP